MAAGPMGRVHTWLLVCAIHLLALLCEIERFIDRERTERGRCLVTIAMATALVAMNPFYRCHILGAALTKNPIY